MTYCTSAAIGGLLDISTHLSVRLSLEPIDGSNSFRRSKYNWSWISVDKQGEGFFVKPIRQKIKITLA